MSGEEKRREPLRVHLGCAQTTPSGWVNVDGSWDARLAQLPPLRAVAGRMGLTPRRTAAIEWDRDVLIHDLRRPLPFPDASVDAIYSSHTLEHLYRDEARSLLRECWRVLGAGGVIRLVVPDLEAIVGRYVEARAAGDALAADRLMSALLVRPDRRPRENVFMRYYRAVADLGTHKWMYDAPSLQRLMTEAGFCEVTCMPFRESRIGALDDIEMEHRVLDGAGVCLEGTRP